VLYGDVDGDGYGDPAVYVTSCSTIPGHVTDASDCDDGRADVSPSADEYCDGVDNDCDGTVDEDSAVDASSWYQDLDGDGVGGGLVAVTGCEAPSGYASGSDDCDDLDDTVYPGAGEECDGADNDCDDEIDEELLGTGEACPAESCLVLHTADSEAGNGLYWIDPDGAGGFETFCVMSTDGSGGGWTLAIRGVLNSSYAASFGREVTDNDGFMHAFESLPMTDVMVVPGTYDLFATDPPDPTHFMVYEYVGYGSRPLQQEVEDCCTGSYGVDYGIDPPHGLSNSSSSLDGYSEISGLSLRMSQIAGPNDAMFFVVGDSGVSSASYRNVAESSMGVMLGFGSDFYHWTDWETHTGWNTSCSTSGYMDPDVGSGLAYSCTSDGAIFVR
jgi:hypothetical protein